MNLSRFTTDELGALRLISPCVRWLRRVGFALRWVGFALRGVGFALRGTLSRRGGSLDQPHQATSRWFAVNAVPINLMIHGRHLAVR